jgi:hypothetical protein
LKRLSLSWDQNNRVESDHQLQERWAAGVKKIYFPCFAFSFRFATQNAFILADCRLRASGDMWGFRRRRFVFPPARAFGGLPGSRLPGGRPLRAPPCRAAMAWLRRSRSARRRERISEVGMLQIIPPALLRRSVPQVAQLLMIDCLHRGVACEARELGYWSLQLRSVLLGVAHLAPDGDRGWCPAAPTPTKSY